LAARPTEYDWWVVSVGLAAYRSDKEVAERGRDLPQAPECRLEAAVEPKTQRTDRAILQLQRDDVVPARVVHLRDANVDRVWHGLHEEAVRLFVGAPFDARLVELKPFVDEGLHALAPLAKRERIIGIAVICRAHQSPIEGIVAPNWVAFLADVTAEPSDQLIGRLVEFRRLCDGGEWGVPVAYVGDGWWPEGPRLFFRRAAPRGVVGEGIALHFAQRSFFCRRTHRGGGCGHLNVDSADTTEQAEPAHEQ